jgi:hypothetical protein
LKITNTFFIYAVFLTYAVVIFFPIEYLGFFETFIRILCVFTLFKKSLFKFPIVILFVLNFILSVLVSDYKVVSLLLSTFDFCLPFMLISKFQKNPSFFKINLSLIRNISIIAISIIIISQGLNLTKEYYPYSDLYTMGPFRNKAIFSLNFLFFVYLNLRNQYKFYLQDYLILATLVLILIFSFRRTSWVLLLFSASSLIVIKNKAIFISLFFALIVPFVIYYWNNLSNVFLELLQDRSSEYLFSIDETQWRVQELLLHINDFGNTVFTTIFGHYSVDPGGSEFWGRLGIENSIHVDFIRLTYYFGYISLPLYLVVIFKHLKKLTPSKFLLFQIISIYLVVFTSGGLLLHIFNIIIFFNLITSFLNEKNLNTNLKLQ